MTDNRQTKPTLIGLNIGTVNGNIGQQHIHNPQPLQQTAPEPPAQPAEATAAETVTKPHETAEAQATAELQESAEAAPMKLTRAQAVILFSALLGEPLQQGFGQHKTRLADLISKVTGYTKGGVRQKIIEIANMSVYPDSIQQDAEFVAKIIESYKPQIANDIRIEYLDE